MANLPEDVLWNIFILLKAKQLVQMRCVSRSLKSLLSHPFFIKSHLDGSVDNNDGIVLFWPDYHSIYAKPITAHPSQSPHLELTNFIKLPVNPQSKNSRGRVIGCVNGLICFGYRPATGSVNAVYIWNPALSKVLTLPPYSVASDFDDCIKINYFGFRFDPKTSDYKVVNLTQGYKPTHIQLKFEIEIYSMRKGCWELTTQKIPSHVRWVDEHDQICGDGHDGHLHLFAKTSFDWNCILSFDLGAGTFREIPLPDSIRYDRAFFNCLGVLAKKLCVMSKDPDDVCEVWVMDEYGVAESWVKRHVFPLFSGIIWPYGFTSHNESLFQAYPHGLSLYDPIAATTKSFKLHGGCGELGKVVEYVESLVWVTPAPGV